MQSTALVDTKLPAQQKSAVASTGLQTPHTLRLLKLIREGSPEYARLALDRLQLDDRRPDVLWDLLGRLQEILTTAPEWKTRQAAATALEHVARTLGSEGGESLWLQQQTDHASNNTSFLTIDSLNVETILRNGRRLYSVAETIYENEAETIDNAATVEERLLLQRELLARRLGLGSLCSAIGGGRIKEVLPDTITEQDMLLPTKKKRKTTCAADEALLPESETLFRTLLVETAATAQHTPQALLATELLVGVMDPVWTIRHGALLGLLALVRAWKGAWGPWLHDALVRVLSVGTILDRFGDFGGSDAVVAPIREVAGQLAAVLLQLADRATRESAFGILRELGNNSEMEWEMRHGVLAVYKFTIVTACSNFIEHTDSSTSQSSSLTDAQWRCMCEQSVNCLSDASEDVKSAASQVLIEIVQRHVPHVDIWSSAKPIWMELNKANGVSSYIKDLVGLFVALIEKDVEKYMSVAGCDSGVVVRLLCTFLDSQFESIRTAAMLSVGLVASVSRFWNDAPFERSAAAAQDSSSVEHEAQQVVASVFDTFFASAATVWGTERDTTWGELCRLQMPQNEASLLVTLLDHYFFAETTRDALPAPASKALAQFLEQCGGVGSVVEVALMVMFQSPWAHQCEAACLLFRHVAANVDRSSPLFQFVTDAAFLEQKPRCLECCNGNHLHSVVGVCRAAFRSILERVRSSPGESEAALSNMLQLWKRSVPTLQDTASSSVREMRVSTSIAGARLASGLPTKATPIVRPLMTSLKNETASLRRTFTCTYTVEFIVGSIATTQHANAVEKILKNLVEAVTSEEESCLGMAATCILQNLVLALPTNAVLHDLPIISEYLSYIGEPSQADVNSEHVIGGVRVLLVVSKGLKSDSHITPMFVSLVRPLVRLSTNTELQELAMTSVVCLCELSPDPVLQEAVPVLMELLSTSKTRKHACRFLKRLVDSAEVAVCPFMRKLLPAVLSVIADKRCGKHAYELFASLVRIAPLVSRESTVTGEKSVIDHLIFGEPLPNYDLPQHVESALDGEGIVLRGYQKEGVAWLQFLQSVKLSGALCDDMGYVNDFCLTRSSQFYSRLGKTLQALIGVAIAHHEAPNRPTSLVVCPSTLVTHWAAEVEKYFPNSAVFNVLCLTGTREERARAWLQRKNEANLVIASYSVLRSDASHLSSQTWCYCLLDEGHLMKNPKTGPSTNTFSKQPGQRSHSTSETAKAARQLEAKNKLIMTGTPIQNKVEELFSVFDFLMPNFLGDHRAFVREFANPIAKGQKEGSGATDIVEGISKLKNLHQMVLPFLLRREKDHVLHELPAKISTVVKVPLQGLQRQIYDRFCSSQVGSSFTEELGDKIPEGTFKVLLYLRLLCTHPCLVLSGDSAREKAKDLQTINASGKLLALAELLREIGFIDTDIVAVDNDQSLLYCEDDALGQTARMEVETSLGSPDEAVGSLSVRTKSEETWASQTSKCLIFAQFTKSLDAVEDFVMTMLLPSCKYVRLDGSVPSADRLELVNTFNTDPSTRILLSTTKVGGVGLNLTAADTVIFLEHDFNPHADLQAIDRTRRIGQTKVVKVYKIVAADTLDEKLLSIQEKKLALSEAIINTDNSTMYTMGTDRLLDIFSVRPTNHPDGKLPAADLDHLTECFLADYESLSASFFAESLK